jgi:hypothetical protein
MNTSRCYGTILPVLLLILGFGIAANAQDRGPLTFAGFVQNVDTSKKTSLYVKQFWKDVKGQEVSWSGTVKDVKGGRGSAEVLVANKSGQTYKGYNLVLKTRDVPGAARLEYGQVIKFTGKLNKYKARPGNPTIIYLSEVEFH